MSESRNRHRLKRRIPDGVKRVVRQESFFGCVVCGKIPYRYEHFDPPFKDATKHDPQGMALLCSSCEDNRTAGRLAVETVRAGRLHPFNKSRDARYLTNFQVNNLNLSIGRNGIEYFGADLGIVVNGDPLIVLGSPKIPGDSWGLTGTFSDPARRASLVLDGSEIVVSRGVWDFTLEGNALTVRTTPGEIVVRLVLDPDSSSFVLERLKMGLGGGFRVEVDEDGVHLFGPGEKEAYLHFGSRPGSRPCRMGGSLVLNTPELGRARDWVRYETP